MSDRLSTISSTIEGKDPEIAKVLAQFHHEQSLKLNMKNMEKTFTADTLNNTVDYLLTLQDTYPSACKKLMLGKFNRIQQLLLRTITYKLQEVLH